MHDASVRLVPPGLTIGSLGASDRAGTLARHSAGAFTGNLRGGVKTVDEFMFGAGKRRARK